MIKIDNIILAPLFTKVLLLSLTLHAVSHVLISQESKDPIKFEQLITTNEDWDDFLFTDAGAWRLQGDGDRMVLELFKQSKYQPPVRSPVNIALMRSPVWTDFTLDVQLKQTGREYGHRDMCIFFGLKDASDFYYVHLASVADQNAHGIFIVNDEDRRNISSFTTGGISWGDEWHHVRIVRDTHVGSIVVFFDDMDNPVMEANDHHFPQGLIGFGSFDDTGMIDEIRITGLSVEVDNEIFRNN